MRFGMVLAALVALTFPAMAADLGPMPTKAAPGEIYAARNWTGFYLGIFGGYHAGDLKESGCVGLCALNPKLEGGLFGVQGGFDYQFSNNIVVGAFAMAPIVFPDTTINIGCAGCDFHTDGQYVVIVGGRLGYAWGRALPYVFGGAGFASVKVHADITNVTVKNDYVGPALGLGVEYRLIGNVSVDARYTYMSLPKRTYDFAPPGNASQIGETSNNFTLGINYRF